MIQWEDKTPVAGLRALQERSGPEVSFADERRDAGNPVVYWQARCREQIYAHLLTSKLEQGGLLLGRAFCHGEAMPNAAVALIDVVDSVAATESHGTPVSLSMGAALWDSARARCEQRTDDALVVVGWYHSHPRLSAFFSATDRRTQAGFFREPWQLGLCVDPSTADEAWFRGGESVVVDSADIVLV